MAFNQRPTVQMGTDYPGGSMRTRTQLPGLPMYGDMSNQYRALRGSRGGGEDFGPSDPQVMTQAPNPMQYRPPSEEDVLKLKILKAQADALTKAAPMKMTQFANSWNGYMPDVNAMTGAQRQVHLPQNAIMDPIRDAQSGALEAAAADADFERFRVSSGGAPRSGMSNPVTTTGNEFKPNYQPSSMYQNSGWNPAHTALLKSKPKGRADQHAWAPG